MSVKSSTHLWTICNKITFMAWVMEDSLDEDMTNLGAGLYPNTGQYVLAMCLSNQENSFLGCQGVSNSSHYILIRSTPASRATSLQTLKCLFPHAFPEEMQFLTMFPATLRTSSTTTWPICRMGYLDSCAIWREQLTAADAVQREPWKPWAGLPSHQRRQTSEDKQLCPWAENGNKCAFLQPICKDSWSFTSLFLQFYAGRFSKLLKKNQKKNQPKNPQNFMFVYYFCIFRSPMKETITEKQSCVQSQVPGATLPNWKLQEGATTAKPIQCISEYSEVTPGHSKKELMSLPIN